VSYEIVFYNARVETAILEWPPGIAANFATIAERIEIYGPNLGLPHTAAMGGGLFEIRAKWAEGIGRALFCTVRGRRIIILHGFIKKTQKTPLADLKIARARLKEIADD
jgi:phage-related protein